MLKYVILIVINVAYNIIGQQLLTLDSLSEVLDCTAVWEKRSKWYNIGLKLDIEPGTLDAIRHDCHHQCEECLREVLKEWLKRVEPRSTWDALQEALNSPLVVSDDQGQQL